MPAQGSPVDVEPGAASSHQQPRQSLLCPGLGFSLGRLRVDEAQGRSHGERNRFTWPSIEGAEPFLPSGPQGRKERGLSAWGDGIGGTGPLCWLPPWRLLSGLGSHCPSGPPCVSSDSGALGTERAPQRLGLLGRDTGLTWLLPPRKDTKVTELKRWPRLYTEAGSGFPRSAGGCGAPGGRGQAAHFLQAGPRLLQGLLGRLCLQAASSRGEQAWGLQRCHCRPARELCPGAHDPATLPAPWMPRGQLEFSISSSPSPPHYTNPACPSPGFSSPDGTPATQP